MLVEDNYTKEWAVQRKKGNKLVLFRVPITQEIKESYSLFRITYVEFKQLLATGLWNQVDEFEYVSQATLNTNNDLKTAFFDIAKNHISKSTRKEVSKKVQSDVPGTSCLIRSANKTYIQIGFRKGANHTQLNRVCIDNFTREKFFDDCRYTDDPLATTYYKIRAGYKCFDYWSNFMDKEYERQINK